MLQIGLIQLLFKVFVLDGFVATSVHAAVIAINEAIDRQVAPDTLAALQNPMAHLINISEDLDDGYQATLLAAKQHKSEVAQNKVRLMCREIDCFEASDRLTLLFCSSQSLDPDYVPDVYDELLTQAEIQGNVNKANSE